MPNINGVITFKATVSIARKPKYLLGIKIHRAIVQIRLGTDHGIYRHVCSRRADTRPEPVGRGKDETGERPYCGDCTGTPFVQDHDGIRAYPRWKRRQPGRYTICCGRATGWRSPREVDSRITKIYADLVSLEKMIHYKRSIIDVLKDVAP